MTIFVYKMSNGVAHFVLCSWTVRFLYEKINVAVLLMNFYNFYKKNCLPVYNPTQHKIIINSIDITQTWNKNMNIMYEYSNLDIIEIYSVTKRNRMLFHKQYVIFFFVWCMQKFDISATQDNVLPFFSERISFYVQIPVKHSHLLERHGSSSCLPFSAEIHFWSSLLNSLMTSRSKFGSH